MTTSITTSNPPEIKVKMQLLYTEGTALKKASTGTMYNGTCFQECTFSSIFFLPKMAKKGSVNDKQVSVEQFCTESVPGMTL